VLLRSSHLLSKAQSIRLCLRENLAAVTRASQAKQSLSLGALSLKCFARVLLQQFALLPAQERLLDVLLSRDRHVRYVRSRALLRFHFSELRRHQRALRAKLSLTRQQQDLRRDNDPNPIPVSVCAKALKHAVVFAITGNKQKEVKKLNAKLRTTN